MTNRSDQEGRVLARSASAPNAVLGADAVLRHGVAKGLSRVCLCIYVCVLGVHEYSF